MIVYELEEVIAYLKKRGLQKLYLKNKKLLEQNQFRIVDFRKRQPKKDGIFYFKLDKKFRAIGYRENKNTFIVTEISDHQ